LEGLEADLGEAVMTSDANLAPLTRDKSKTKLSQENGLAAVLAPERREDLSVSEPESAGPDQEIEAASRPKQAAEEPRASQPAVVVAPAPTKVSLAPPLPPQAPAKPKARIRVEAPIAAPDAAPYSPENPDPENPASEKPTLEKPATPSAIAPAKAQGSAEPADAAPSTAPVTPAAVAVPPSESIGSSQPWAAAAAPAPAVAVQASTEITGGPRRFPSSPGLPPRDAADADNGAFEEATVAAHFESLLDDHSEGPSIRPGDLCRGRVVSVSASGVVVDIGSKCEGIVPIDDFFGEGDQPQLPDGDEIDVLIERPGAFGEYAVLSYRRARQIRVWEEIEEAFREQKTVEGRVLERVKGGLTVDVGVPAFLPGSQMDVRPANDVDSLLGTTVPVRIIKVNKRRGNVVVSRRVLMEEELREIKQQTLANLELGAIVEGTVKSVTDYGAFVDLGGLDGLIHLIDISWGRVQAPGDVLKAGDQVTAKVIKFDPQKERVSLSIRELTPDPWVGITERHEAGRKIMGKVTSLNDYGAFVEVEPGVEGLVHVSEMSWSQRARHPSKIVKLEDQVEAVILKIDPDARRISLSLKQNKPDPWLDLSERYPIGTVVEGHVRNMTSYGAFVEIEEGVEGLIHISDLSWDQRLKHPEEVLRKGRTTRAVVMHVDTPNRKLSLGVKQLQPDQWETFFSCYLVGDEVTGSPTRITNFGVFVELAPGVEGLCHISEIPGRSNGGKQSRLKIGQAHKFKVVKLDEFGKKIGLSRHGVIDDVADEEPRTPPADARPAGRKPRQRAKASAPPTEPS
jgi:small subunit ribosomal protein S1